MTHRATQVRGDVEKWRSERNRFESWDTPKQRAVQTLEAKLILEWILELHLPRYTIVELGCGNGLVGKIITEGLHKAGVDFTYCFSDLLPECVDSAQALMGDVSFRDQLSFRQLDVYNADTELGQASCDVVVSTGFISAATYRDAIPRVTAIVRPGGVIIADYINHFSLTILLSQPIRSIVRLLEYLRGTGKPYHFGILGVQKMFGRYGFVLERFQTVRLRRNPIVCLLKKET